MQSEDEDKRSESKVREPRGKHEQPQPEPTRPTRPTRFRIIGVSRLANEQMDYNIATEFLSSPEPAHVEDWHTYITLVWKR